MAGASGVVARAPPPCDIYIRGSRRVTRTRADHSRLARFWPIPPLFDSAPSPHRRSLHDTASSLFRPLSLNKAISPSKHTFLAHTLENPTASTGSSRPLPTDSYGGKTTRTSPVPQPWPHSPNRWGDLPPSATPTRRLFAKGRETLLPHASPLSTGLCPSLVPSPVSV